MPASDAFVLKPQNHSPQVEGRSKKEGIYIYYTYIIDTYINSAVQFNSLYSRNQHNIVKQLYALSCSVMPGSLRPFGLYPSRLLCHWEFAGKNTGVACHFPVQRIFPTQGQNPHLLSLLQILYLLSHCAGLLEQLYPN